MPQLTVQKAIDLALQRQRIGQTAEAEQIYRQILIHEPNHANALHLLGALVAEAGRRDEAVALMRRAVRVLPSAVDCWLNLGTVLFGQDKYDEAADAFAHAARFQPGVHTFGNLGTALRRAGRLTEAAVAYRQMMAIRASMVSETWTIADEAELAACDDLLILLHQDPACDAATIFSDHAFWNRVYAAALAPKTARHENDRSPSRRLRIGYVSAYLANRPIGRFLSGLFANHNHAEFEFFCYSDTRETDATTEQLLEACDTWRDTRALTDEQLAERVRQDRIDILIDLGLHAIGNRMLTFARKPAPVQLTYLNYCSTTGLQTIDYRLSDACFDPDDSLQPYYSEQTLRLRSYWCYPPPKEAPDVDGASPSAGDVITFGCLNDSSKINPLTLSIWGDILRRLPRSRLLLHAPTTGDQQRAVAGVGVDPRRLEFVGRLSLESYFNQYRRIDIALDPTPWCGGTTTCDALWMGVPVVTLAGQTAISRGGLSILSQIALADLAAHSPAQYVEVAMSLGRDGNRLATLRTHLRERMRKSPLMDAPAFARDFESILRTVWEGWCVSHPPLSEHAKLKP